MEWTTKDIRVQYEVSAKLVYSWFVELEEVGWARRHNGGRNGTILIEAKGIKFLRWRKGRRGNPQMSRRRVLERWICQVHMQ